MKDWKRRQTDKIGNALYLFTTLSKKHTTVIDGEEYKTYPGKQLNPRYVRKMVKRTAEKAGINKDISPHTLRHTYATDFYRDTGNIRMVQKALGHADISTTMIYTHIVDDELEDAMKNFQSKKRKVG